MTDRSRVIGEVEHYWLVAGLPHDTVEEMKSELTQHLIEAEADGRTVENVIGDRGQFAEAWAAAYRGRPAPTWREVQSGQIEKKRNSRRDLIMYGVGAAALVAAAAVAGQGGSEVDDLIWAWLWTILAIVLGIGEIFTAGFFLLPFAIGAAGAAILGWVGAPLIAQWLVFFGVSIFALAYLRRFIGRQDEGLQPRVGANRWIGSEGVVLQAIDPHSGSGMVRVLNEEWRATASQPIATGTTVVVTDVKGTRLFVEELTS